MFRRKEKILATTDPSFVSVGNCSGLYRCNSLFSVVGGDSCSVSRVQTLCH